MATLYCIVKFLMLNFYQQDVLFLACRKQSARPHIEAVWWVFGISCLIQVNGHQMNAFVMISTIIHKSQLRLQSSDLPDLCD